MKRSEFVSNSTNPWTSIMPEALVCIRFHEHDSEFIDLHWPSQSLDLNLIEHCWDVVEQEICGIKVHLKNIQNCLMHSCQIGSKS